MQSLVDIRNYVRLTPRIGMAGQPCRDQFGLIAEAGFAGVINLAMPDHRDSIADEGALVTGLGMTYCHLPVPFDVPTPDHLRRFCALLEAQQDLPLFVHCIMNYRVSAFMYLYLTRVQGVGDAEARSPIFERWKVEPQWQALMAMDASALGVTPDRDAAHRAAAGVRREYR